MADVVEHDGLISTGESNRSVLKMVETYRRKLNVGSETHAAPASGGAKSGALLPSPRDRGSASNTVGSKTPRSGRKPSRAGWAGSAGASPAVRFEVYLREVLSRLPAAPHALRAAECFHILDEIIPYMGSFAPLIQLLREELLRCVFSGEITTMAEGGNGGVEMQGYGPKQNRGEMSEETAASVMTSKRCPDVPYGSLRFSAVQDEGPINSVVCGPPEDEQDWKDLRAYHKNVYGALVQSASHEAEKIRKRVKSSIFGRAKKAAVLHEEKKEATIKGLTAPFTSSNTETRAVDEWVDGVDSDDELVEKVEVNRRQRLKKQLEESTFFSVGRRLTLVPYFSFIQHTQFEAESTVTVLAQQRDVLLKKLGESEKHIAALVDNTHTLRMSLAEATGNVNALQDEVMRLQETIQSLELHRSEAEFASAQEVRVLQSELHVASVRTRKLHTERDVIKEYRDAYDELAAVTDRIIDDRGEDAGSMTLVGTLMKAFREARETELQLRVIRTRALAEYERSINMFNIGSFRNKDAPTIGDGRSAVSGAASGKSTGLLPCPASEDCTNRRALLQTKQGLRDVFLSDFELLEEELHGVLKTQVDLAAQLNKLTSLDQSLSGYRDKKSGPHFNASGGHLLVSCDGGKTYSSIPGQFECDVCDSVVAICPHLKQDVCVVVPKNISHIKVVHPQLRAVRSFERSRFRPETEGAFAAVLPFCSATAEDLSLLEMLVDREKSLTIDVAVEVIRQWPRDVFDILPMEPEGVDHSVDNNIVRSKSSLASPSHTVAVLEGDGHTAATSGSASATDEDTTPRDSAGLADTSGSGDSHESSPVLGAEKRKRSQSVSCVQAARIPTPEQDEETAYGKLGSTALPMGKRLINAGLVNTHGVPQPWAVKHALREIAHRDGNIERAACLDMSSYAFRNMDVSRVRHAARLLKQFVGTALVAGSRVPRTPLWMAHRSYFDRAPMYVGKRTDEDSLSLVRTIVDQKTLVDRRLFKRARTVRRMQMASRGWTASQSDISTLSAPVIEFELNRSRYLGEFIFAYLRDVYVLEDAVHSVAFDIFCSLERLEYSDRWCRLICLVLRCALPDCLLAYALSLRDIVCDDSLRLTDSRSVTTLFQIVYPFLDESDLELLTLEFVSFARDARDADVVMDFLLRELLTGRDPRVVGMYQELLSRSNALDQARLVAASGKGVVGGNGGNGSARSLSAETGGVLNLELVEKKKHAPYEWREFSLGFDDFLVIAAEMAPHVDADLLMYGIRSWERHCDCMRAEQVESVKQINAEVCDVLRPSTGATTASRATNSRPSSRLQEGSTRPPSVHGRPPSVNQDMSGRQTACSHESTAEVSIDMLEDGLHPLRRLDAYIVEVCGSAGLATVAHDVIVAKLCGDRPVEVVSGVPTLELIKVESELGQECMSAPVYPSLGPVWRESEMEEPGIDIHDIGGDGGDNLGVNSGERFSIGVLACVLAFADITVNFGAIASTGGTEVDNAAEIGGIVLGEAPVGHDEDGGEHDDDVELIVPKSQHQ